MKEQQNKEQAIHPMTSAIREIVSIFDKLGFSVADGPEIETDYYNFEALNFPKDHPARDMQDTFWLPDGRVLRTQTSDIQIHFMEEHKPPIRVIAPGKVYRSEATDMKHEAQFYQFEGLAIDEKGKINLGHLQWTIRHFFDEFFGDGAEVRMRPSYFPFVEPAIEFDMRLTGEHIPKRLRGKWIEVLPGGMVHPNVLRNAGIDPEKYGGFAFAGGIERLAMMRWIIDDIRLFHHGDLRFVNQFIAGLEESGAIKDK
jgi:phenylalanyl-tRNA synthetase alpha chain